MQQNGNVTRTDLRQAGQNGTFGSVGGAWHLEEPHVARAIVKHEVGKGAAGIDP